MKLENTKQAYYDSSAKASEICRQLAFAALATVWIFKIDQVKGVIAVPHALVGPALLAIFALAFDLSQYVYKSIAWGCFNLYKEHKTDKNERAEFLAPQWINWPALFFFGLKILFVAGSYVELLNYLFHTISH